LPVVGLKRRCRQSRLVEKIGRGGSIPAEADLGRRVDALGRNDDGFAVDGRGGGGELAVFPGNLKMGESLSDA